MRATQFCVAFFLLFYLLFLHICTMNFKFLILIIISFFTLKQSIFSQDLEIKSLRSIPVTMHIDLNYAPIIPLNKYKEQYKGELYFPAFEDSSVWINRNEIISLSTLYPLYSFGIKISVELDKKYRFGLNYKPIIIKDLEIPYAESSLIGSGNSTTFFLISGFMGYSWHYFQSKIKIHELQLYPYFGFGSYIGNNYFQGAGRRFLINTGLEHSYIFNHKFGIDIGLEYNYWRYKNDYFVPAFNLQHTEKLKFNFISAEIGFKFLIGLKK